MPFIVNSCGVCFSVLFYEICLSPVVWYLTSDYPNTFSSKPFSRDLTLQVIGKIIKMHIHVYSKTFLQGALQWKDTLWPEDIFQNNIPLLSNLQWKDSCPVGKIVMAHWVLNSSLKMSVSVVIVSIIYLQIYPFLKISINSCVVCQTLKTYWLLSMLNLSEWCTCNVL